MLEKYFHVTWNPESRDGPLQVEIEQIFGGYGRLKRILRRAECDNNCYYIIEFRHSTDAMRCHNEKLALQQNHRFFVENLFFSENNSIDLNEDASPADPDDPYLTQLDEHCLLHILSFLNVDELEGIGYACRRTMRLSRERMRKNKRLTCNSTAYKLDKLFFSTSALTELRIKDIFERSFYEIALLCCKNLKRLHLNCSRSELRSNSSYFALRRLMVTVKELTLNADADEDRPGDESLVYSESQLTKLKVVHNFQFSIINTVFYPRNQISVCLPNLTALLMPYYEMDIAVVLSNLPQLRAFACTLKQERTRENLPLRHNCLSEFYFRVHPRSKDEMSDRVLKLRGICPNLRHLRIGNYTRSFIPLLPTLLPLDGLHLNEYVDLFGEFNVVMEVLKDELKIVNIPRLSWDDCRKVMKNFPKLEMIYCRNVAQWHRWAERLSTGPLVIVGYDAEDHWPISVRSVNRFVDFFGPFSIYDNEDDDYDSNYD